MFQRWQRYKNPKKNQDVTIESALDYAGYDEQRKKAPTQAKKKYATLRRRWICRWTLKEERKFVDDS